MLQTVLCQREDSNITEAQEGREKVPDAPVWLRVGSRTQEKRGQQVPATQV